MKVRLDHHPVPIGEIIYNPNVPDHQPVYLEGIINQCSHITSLAHPVWLIDDIHRFHRAKQNWQNSGVSPSPHNWTDK